MKFQDMKLNDEMPIYQQIIRFVKIGIVAGEFIDGEELPSRRLLSSMLKVNPNTIQKAFSCLEDEKIIVSYAGAKSVLTLTDEKVRMIREDLIKKEAKQYIESVSNMGLSLQQAIGTIEQLWGKGQR